MEDSVRHQISLIEQDYDALPYISMPFPQSHPGRLAAAATLLGLAPPDVENARILELGCASGGNLIPVAAYLPRTHCVGIDLGGRQIRDGRARIDRLGLSNVELRQLSITDVGPELGEFDYIIAHGVFSWVPALVRDAVLRICRENLAPTGVAYISFNVAPGWRMYQPIRDAIEQMIPDDLIGQGRLEAANSLLRLIEELAQTNETYGKELAKLATQLLDLPAAYLMHDYLSHVNEPVTVTDFLRSAHKHELCYLADADFSTSFPDNFGPKFSEAVGRRTGGQVYAFEQLFDIISGRTFREACLVHEGQASKIDHNVIPHRLNDLHLTLARSAKVSRDGDRIVVSNRHGLEASFDHPTLARTMQRLHDQFPGTIAFATLLDGFDAQASAAVASVLTKLVTTGILEATARPVDLVALSPCPKVSALARSDAASGEDRTVSRRHESILLDPTTRLLLCAMDGETPREELQHKLRVALKDGTLDLEDDKPLPGEDGPELDALVETMLAESLQELSRFGLLEG